VVGSRIQGSQRRPHKAFLIVVYYISRTLFVCDVFWGVCVIGTKFGDAYYKIPYALDHKPTSARIPMFYLCRQFARYRIYVYVTDFVCFFGPRSKKRGNMHNIEEEYPNCLRCSLMVCRKWSAFLMRKDSNDMSSRVEGMSISLTTWPTDRRTWV